MKKPTDGNLAEVDANLFRAAHICVSTEEVRYYINGVYIQKHPSGGVLLIATDGHRMMVIHDESGSVQKPIIVKLDGNMLKACAPTKKIIAPRLTILKDGCASLPASRTSATAIIDGDYPDWRRCTPVQKWEMAPASFNGRYLGDFGKISSMLSGQGPGAIRMLTGSKDFGLAIILFPYTGNAFGILMPMRAEIANGGLPAWMKPVMATFKPALEKKPKPERKKKR